MKWLFVFWIILLMASNPTEASGQTLRWTSIDKLGDSLKNNLKPIMVFIQTDWCKYCKMQVHFTFKDKEVVELLNQNFYSLKLNAEDKETLKFMGRSYAPGTAGTFHTLVRMLGLKNQKLLFPTTVFYSPFSQTIERLQGLQQPEDLASFIINGYEVRIQ